MEVTQASKILEERFGIIIPDSVTLLNTSNVKERSPRTPSRKSDKGSARSIEIKGIDSPAGHR